MKNEMRILRMTKRSMVRATCIVQPKDIERAKDLILMFGLNDTIVELTIENNVSWYYHMFCVRMVMF